MIHNTSKILNEKYIERIQKDDEGLLESKSVKDSLTKKSIANVAKNSDSTQNLKTPFEIFSNRYSQIPKNRVNSHMEMEDEVDEHDALNSKQTNIAKLKTPFKMVS
jgi:hypothetical protein